MKKYIVKGKNEKEILQKTSEVLGVAESKLKYEIININKGIFGKINEIEMKIWIEDLGNETEKHENTRVELIVEKEIGISENIKIEIEKEGVFITLLKNYEIKREEFNKKLLELFAYIEKKEIKNIDKDKIRTILLNANGEKVKIAEYIEDYYIDGKVKIVIEESKMTACIELIEPIRGNEITYEAILNEIEKSGVKYGVDLEIIRNCLENKLYGEKIVFAKGEIAEDGKDAIIEYKFETDISPKFYIDDMGRVDFKTIMNTIKNVSMGDIVAVRTPGTNGKNGKNVLGEEILPVFGKDKNFIKGDNVIEGMDSDELISMIDGRVVLKKEEINVYPVLEISGDIDLKNGNVNFMGVVIIKGNVRDGFKVEAKGDVVIEGLVEDAVVISGGNIFVKNGILGKEGGTGIIKAEGNISTKFLQNVRVESKKNVEVLEYILNSAVEADERVIALNGKGKIIGGKIVAGIKIAAREIGNMYGAKTEIEIGLTEQIYEQKIKVETEYNGKVDELEKVELGLKKVLDNLYWKNPTFDKVKYINELKKDIMRVSEEKSKLDEKVKSIKKGNVFIRDTMYRGVALKIDGVQLNLKESFNYARFYLNEKKELSFGSFDEDETK